MTLLIKLPGTLTSTTGLPRLITTLDGFPDNGLTDLFLFEDGSGTTPGNSVSGKAAGVIEAPVAVNNAYAWLSGGGGISLSGSQIMTAPAYDASGPWTMVSAGSMIGSVGGTASERISGVVGHKQFGQSTVRGAALYIRGGNDWNTGTPTPSYQGRAANNGSQGTVVDALPTTIQEIGKQRLRVISYNGSSTITVTIYDKDGAVVSTASLSTTDTEMFTVSGVTVTSLNPCLGLSSGTYAGGQQQVEAFAHYSRVLDYADISVILTACTALGTARSRIWT